MGATGGKAVRREQFSFCNCNACTVLLQQRCIHHSTHKSTCPSPHIPSLFASPHIPSPFASPHISPHTRPPHTCSSFCPPSTSAHLLAFTGAHAVCNVHVHELGRQCHHICQPVHNLHAVQAQLCACQNLQKVCMAWKSFIRVGYKWGR